MALDADTEMAFLQNSPELDKVEADLRTGGHGEVADALLKLQQDIGMDYSGASADDGPQTAKLAAQYQGDFETRMPRILRDCQAGLSDASLKSWLSGFMQELKLGPVPPPAPVKPPRPPGQGL